MKPLSSLKLSTRWMAALAVCFFLGAIPANAVITEFDDIALDGAGSDPFIRLDQTGQGDYFIVGFSQGLQFWSGAGYALKILNDAPSDVLTLDAGGVTIEGDLSFSSSKHVKSDIHQLSEQEALETFEDLNPVKFRYLNTPDEQSVGFIAEDLPDLVASSDHKGLNPMDLVAVLTKVIQNQQREIDALKSDVEKLLNSEKSAQ